MLHSVGRIVSLIIMPARHNIPIIVSKLTRISLMFIRFRDQIRSIGYFPYFRLTIVPTRQYFRTVIAEIYIEYDTIMRCVYSRIQ